MGADIVGLRAELECYDLVHLCDLSEAEISQLHINSIMRLSSGVPVRKSVEQARNTLGNLETRSDVGPKDVREVESSAKPALSPSSSTA